jgi:hypothetical protein
LVKSVVPVPPPPPLATAILTNASVAKFDEPVAKKFDKFRSYYGIASI